MKLLTSNNEDIHNLHNCKYLMTFIAFKVTGHNSDEKYTVFLIVMTFAEDAVLE